jgi:X-Pro dipeptidyl-peptidase
MTFEEPEDWTNEYDYFLVRGFAVVEAAGLGTFGSEGIECYSTVMERDAFVAIVEWLAGKEGRHAFTNPADNVEIKADWSGGSVGMIGLSYPAEMAYATATSGVEGLKTVVPMAGPISMYDEHNSQGICT